jgi:hypothetical protein
MEIYNDIINKINLNTKKILNLVDINILDNIIMIYMRIGGGNRDAYAEYHWELSKNKYYIKDHDDKNDNTIAIYYFQLNNAEPKIVINNA